jgi:hypothetical protein
MNSTDATIGQPIIQRVQTRQQELSTILATLPPENDTLRSAIQLALDTVAVLIPDGMSTVPSTVMGDLNQWLEDNKYLGETAGA